MTKHTILFLAANPFGDRIALDQEARAIQIELERSGHREHFEFVTRWAVQPLDLLRELRKLRPTVVHFSGHGGDADHRDGLFFQGSDGERQLVSTAALEETFGAAGSSVRLVVLNACYSDMQADALLTYVGCVIGMAGSISDDVAKSFAIGFYGGLGERQTIDAAYRQGRAAIRLDGLPIGARPQLRVRQDVDADALILAGLHPPEQKDDTTRDRRPSAQARTAFARFIGVPPRKSTLFGRSEVLAKLQAHVKQSAAIALCGVPGIGKTSIVLSLIYDKQLVHYFTGGVYWARMGPCADPAIVLERWERAVIGAIGEGDLIDRAEQLAVSIQERAAGDPVLLVFDDAWEWSHIQPLASIAFSGCCQLLTTRRLDLAKRFAEVPMQIESLAIADADSFAACRCAEAARSHPAQLRALVRRLGGNPLALSLVLDQLREASDQPRWIGATLEKLSTAQSRLKLPAAVDSGASATLRDVVELSTHALDIKTHNMFVALGAFAPKPADFSRAAVIAVTESNESDIDDLLKTLVARSLIDQEGNDRFSVHQLIWDVANAELPENAEARERHGSYFNRLVMEGVWERINREFDQVVHARGRVPLVTFHTADGPKELRPVAILKFDRGQSLSNGFLARASEATDLVTMPLFDRLLTSESSATLMAQYEEARRPLRASQMFSHHESRAIANMRLLALRNGDVERADSLLCEAQAVVENELECAPTPKVFLDLIETLQLLGDIEKAIEVGERAIAKFRAENENVAVVLGLTRLAEIYCAQGNDVKAEALFNEALSLVEQPIGEVLVRCSFARIPRDQGRTVEAIAHCTRALAVLEDNTDELAKSVSKLVSGMLHVNLALLYETIGDLTQARKHVGNLDTERLVDASTYARNVHDLIVDSYASCRLGLLVLNKKDALAMLLLSHAAEVLVGRTHPLRVSALMALGQCYGVMREFVRAAASYEEAATTARDVGDRELEAQAIMMLEALNPAVSDEGETSALRVLVRNIKEMVMVFGTLFRLLGWMTQGVARWVRRRRRLRTTLGEGNAAAGLNSKQRDSLEQAAADTFNARIYRGQGEYTRAAKLYERALRIKEEVLGGEHPDVALSLTELGLIYRLQDSNARAAPLCERALRIFETTLGAEHPDVVTSLNNLAVIYQGQGAYLQAMPLLKRALSIAESVHGSESSQVADALSNLAMHHYAQGAYALAAPLWERQLGVLETVLGTGHPEVAGVLSNLSLHHYAQGAYAQAASYLERALCIVKTQLGPEHPDVATVLSHLAMVHRAQGTDPQPASLLKRE